MTSKKSPRRQPDMPHYMRPTATSSTRTTEMKLYNDKRSERLKASNSKSASLADFTPPENTRAWQLGNQKERGSPGFSPDLSAASNVKPRIKSKPALPWMNDSTKVKVEKDRDPICGIEKAEGSPVQTPPPRSKKQFAVTQVKTSPYAWASGDESTPEKKPATPSKPVSRNYTVGTDALPKGSMTFEKTSSDFKAHSSGDTPVRAQNKTLYRGSDALPTDGGMSFNRTSTDYGTTKATFEPDAEIARNKAKILERKTAAADARAPPPQVTAAATERAPNRNFSRGTQAFPDGNMSLSSTSRSEFLHHRNQPVERAENKTLARSTQALPGGNMTFSPTSSEFRAHNTSSHTPDRAQNKTLTVGTQALPRGSMSFSRTSGDYHNHSPSPTIQRAANKSLQSSIVFG